MAELIGTATAKKDGLMSATDKKLLGNNFLFLEEAGIIKICDLIDGWNAGYIDVTFVCRPGWDKTPFGRVHIALHADNEIQAVHIIAGVGKTSLAKFYVLNNALYVKSNYSYAMACMVSGSGNVHLDFRAEDVDLSSGEEISIG